MAYTDFKNLGQVVQMYQIKVKNTYFLPNSIQFRASEVLHDDITFALEQGLYRASEIAIGEQLIYPILREVWKKYFIKNFLLWSHTAFGFDSKLSGSPDYLFAERTDYDNAVVGPPILVAIEAKKDNFEEGWGQCAAEMVAATKANEANNCTFTKIYGIVTNGDKWEFAQLENNTFTKNIAYIDVMDLDKLFNAIHFVLSEVHKPFA
jgi:hypothetical protein